MRWLLAALLALNLCASATIGYYSWINDQRINLIGSLLFEMATQTTPGQDS